MNDPVRLQKQENTEQSKWDCFCMKICPYVLFICVCLLIITIFVAMVKYGGAWFGTESNIYYNGFRGGV